MNPDHYDEPTADEIEWDNNKSDLIEKLDKDTGLFVKPSTDIPKELYHYTSIASLLGIIKNTCFYMTHYKYMNDPLEMDYAYNLLIDEFQKLGESTSEFDKTFVSQALVHLDSSSRHKGIHVFSSPFFISLSSSSDNLSLWRFYGDNGRGCSIGIDTKKFGEVNNPDFEILGFYEVIYDESKQRSIIDEFIQAFMSVYCDTFDNDKSICALIDEFLYFYFDKIAVYFKHSSYSDEKEWRFAVNVKYDSETRFQYREKNSKIVPFIEYKIPQGDDPWLFDTKNCILKNEITNITLGPVADKSVGFALKTIEQHVKVLHSEIPYIV